MYFSSLLFLFLYLPAVLIGYYILPHKCRNFFLLLVNLVFYGWGEPVLILVMAVSVLVNYIFGILIEKYRSKERLAKTFLIFDLIISLGLLGVFKYAGFLTDILRKLPFLAMLPKIKLALPIGISFYTFQTLSYTIDVYRKDVKAQKNIINFGTYVSFFPQLIAGPIVRYSDIAKQLVSREETVSKFASGIKRFAIGLAKKVLLANQMGLLWDTLREMPNMGAVGAWTGIVAFSLQIYFDFSGYSDMAIGLGRMFGFEFVENFNYPYISKSITDFWRRWHISLSSWFKDYVYIPLGGNRCKTGRCIFNLFVVWALTGLWHGASFNFVLWGVYYFVLLVLEKYVYGKALSHLPSVFRHIYALFFIMLGWVLFCFEDFGALNSYIMQMFGSGGFFAGTDVMSLVKSYAPLLAVSVLACVPLWRNVYSRIRNQKWTALFEILVVCALLFMCTASLVNDSYNPFLYFRF